jgi:D-alanyl-D-alanine carboxypeptidase/D-alanyl-D-alanine-endopeptidase (penicillin-binding protein 4)
MPRQASKPVRTVSVLGLVGLALLTSAYVATDRIATRVTPKIEVAPSVAPSIAVLSARRNPSTLSVITRAGRVERALAPLLDTLPDNSCLRVDWMGAVRASKNTTIPYVPASATKVLTAAVALDVLGPNYTFKTEVHGVIDAGGTTGDLYLVGGGDPLLVRSEYVRTEKYPTLSPTSIESLADQLVAAGVRNVSGSVVGVDTRYDAVRFVDVWPDSFHLVEAGPLGALMINDGAVIGQETKGADPAISAAAEFTNLLSSRGVTVTGFPRHEALPSGSKALATISSAPFLSVLQEMLVNSDNNTSELVIKELGFVKTGVGSTAAGLAVVTETLKQWKVDAGVVLSDGSGLSGSNLIPCDTFMSVLNRFTDVLPPLLAVAGTTGTLSNIFVTHSVQGRLLGKTGTLSGVKTLVGYLPVEGGEPVVFSLLMNRSAIDNQGAYRPIWNALGNALDRAKSTPTIEQLSP